MTSAYIIYEKINTIGHAVLAQLCAISHKPNPSLHIAISGGQTPKCIFNIIRKNCMYYAINWSKMHFWWCDERYVHIDSHQSNFGEAKRLLFDHINIPFSNLHPMIKQITPIKELSIQYNHDLKTKVPYQNNMPSFDWTWLGLGIDGHTASLFSIDNDIITSEKLVEITYPTNSLNPRLTLTPKIINNSKKIDFFVTGLSKEKIVHSIIIRQYLAILLLYQITLKKL